MTITQDRPSKKSWKFSGLTYDRLDPSEQLFEGGVITHLYLAATSVSIFTVLELVSPAIDN